MIRLVFGVLQVLVGLVLVILLAPAFIGHPVPSPLSWLNPFLPAVSFVGGWTGGVLTFMLRVVVLLVMILACVGALNALGRRFR